MKPVADIAQGLVGMGDQGSGLSGVMLWGYNEYPNV